jgi:predicted nucleic acid-binding protein
MIKPRAVLDSNFLLAIVDPLHSHHVPANQILDRYYDEFRYVLLPQVIYEFWVVITRPVENNGMGLMPASAAVLLERLKAVYQFMPDSSLLLQQWQKIVTDYEISGKKAHDARIAAAMQCHDIRALFTFNERDFHRFDFLKIIRPN